MKRFLASALVLLAAPGVAQAQTVDLSRSGPIAPLAGQMSTPAWYQTDIGFWGTDMGFLFKHKDALWIAFGDTVADKTTGAHITPPAGNPPGDDALGAICLQSSANCPLFVPWFTTGDDVDNYIASLPPGPGEKSWQADGPPVLFHTYTQGSTDRVLPISVYNGGINGSRRSEIVPIPGPGFSNYKTGTASAAFVTFNGPIARCGWGCPTGFTCTASSVGVTDDPAYRADPTNDGGYGICTAPGTGCHNVNGVCQDPAGNIARRLEIGNADPSEPTRFFTKSWTTVKMQNMAITTVNNFDKTRSITGSMKNDYRSPTGSPSSSNKVFIWSKVGIDFSHHAYSYFAYVDMPSYNATASFNWAPQYFTGFNSSTGVASFSPNEKDAKPINLSGTASGLTNAEDEVWAYSGIGLAVRWIEPLKKFVMLYGGGYAPQFAAPIPAGLDLKNAIHVRFADQPWGPWSKPQQFLEAGDPAAIPVGSAPGTQYGQNGVLYQIECPLWWGSACAPGELFFKSGVVPFAATVPGTVSSHPFGFLYGPNIIEDWSMSRTSPVPGVDIYWTVSTFDPYQVVLMRTRVKKP